jgi:2-dehydro-3-deoxygluconokinase
MRSATVNHSTAVYLTPNGGFLVGPRPDGLEVLDRVGGGDASAFSYGLVTRQDVAGALSYGVAHGALAMTTPGDTSMATLDKVERLVQGAAPRVAR